MVKSNGVTNALESMKNSHPDVPPSCKVFTLKSNSQFASRCDDVFNKLSTIESKHESWITRNDTIDSFDNSDVQPKSTVKDIGCFKKPFPPKNSRFKPKYHSPRRNSKKWIKYSLADVPLSSDAANSAIAFRFLDELRKRREEKNEKVEVGGKIYFKRPCIDKQKVCNVVASHTEIQSKNVLDTKRKKSCNFESKCDSSLTFNSKIKLQHLMDFDDSNENA